MTPIVKTGDFVCTRNPSAFLRWPINRVQAFWEMDSRAEYSHALRIIDDDGTTFEAGIRVKGKVLHKIGNQNLFEAYAGTRILVARHADFDLDQFVFAFPDIHKAYCGRTYPYHRLVLMAFPYLMKYLNLSDFAVCSELVARQLVEENLMDYWEGVYPAWLTNMARYFKGWNVVFEGVI